MELTGNVAGIIKLLGGGEGSTVTIEPLVTSGLQIAKVTIDEEVMYLYIPTPQDVDVDAVLSSGTKIAEITVNDEVVEIYAPSPTNVIVTPTVQSGTKIADISVNGNITSIYTPSHEYNTTEHVVGVWVDGRPVYEKTFTVITDSNIYYIPNTTDIDHLINISGYANKENFEFYIPYDDSTDNISIAYMKNAGIRIFTSNYFVGAQYVINVQYTKSTDTTTR